ncbi:MAG: tRNA pseudouridine(55) synthase TruB [Luteibaculaceae bacterium]
MIVNPTHASAVTEGSILLIDKPLGYTSFQAVNQLKHAILKTLGIKKIKIGHAGTLDPLATGLLIIGTGKMTKQLAQWQAEQKVYTGKIQLGAYTPSYDLETEITETMPVEGITPALIETVSKSFIGVQEQIPPIFSAKKVDGKRAYDMARKGDDFQLKSSTVEIFELTVDSTKFPELGFLVSCSKGTYIRSLAYDFGKRLNNTAYLKELRREQSGSFNVKNALSPQAWVEKFMAENRKSV